MENGKREWAFVELEVFRSLLPKFRTRDESFMSTRTDNGDSDGHR